MPATSSDASIVSSRSKGRVLAVMAFVIGAFLLLRYQAGVPPKIEGDGWEYWYQIESLRRHATPELWPEDRSSVNEEGLRVGIAPAPAHPHAYFPAQDGRLYGAHFWTYAATAVPANVYLRWVGASELGDQGLTNAVWFVIALGVTLFTSSAPIGQRLALIAFSASGSVLWYLAYTGPELFCWSLTLIAVVTFRDRNYAWSGAAAGLAATQNPPIILFGAVAVLAAACERRWRVAALTVLTTAIGLIPYAFFQYHFGKPNLIAADFARVSYVSWVRSWSLLTDFNQGLLPYLPVLVVAAVAGALRLIYVRDRNGLLLLAGGLAMAVGVQVSRNWNSACDGLQRYVVWMIPVAAGVAVQGIGGRWRLWSLAIAALIVHSAMAYAYQRTNALKGGYLDHTPVATWVLTHCPQAYWIEPEIFVERLQHADDWPMTPADVPMGFVRPDGTVSKLFLDPESIDLVGLRYDVEPGYLATLKEQAARETGLFFAHPPRGAVRVR